VYVEASDSCNDLTVFVGRKTTQGSGTTAVKWNIKVTQYKYVAVVVAFINKISKKKQNLNQFTWIVI
jgi:hypothetical protein